MCTSCLKGYFSGNACVSCPANCLECAAGGCTLCEQGRALPSCAACPKSTYLSNQQCHSCSGACVLCTGPLPADCLSCP